MYIHLYLSILNYFIYFQLVFIIILLISFWKILIYSPFFINYTSDMNYASQILNIFLCKIYIPVSLYWPVMCTQIKVLKSQA